MKEEEATIEHLIPVCRGGKNILENLVLCTEKENQKMGNKSLIQKIKYRDQNRKKEN
jgi:5-methylcytosine-specific restriction endonuclease McrA